MKKLSKSKNISLFLILVAGFFLTFKGFTEDLLPLELSLEEVTEIALENSLDIQIAKFDTYISRTSKDEAESIFDTIFSAEASYNRNRKETASSLAGTDTRETIFSLGLEKKLPTGTTLALDAINTKTKTNSSFTTLNPYTEAGLEFSVTQELGRNFFGLADRAKIKITKIDIENSEFVSLDDIEQFLYAVQRSYWNLALREEELLIAKDMLSEAEKLYEIYKEKKELGLVEESEFLAIEALLKARQSSINVAQLARETAKNDLLFLINRGDFQQNLIPRDSLDIEVFETDLYQALNRAVDSRRDYKRIKNELEKNKIDLVVKKNALWPQIDFEATFTRNNIDTGRSQAWGDIFSDGGEDVFFKVSFEVPLEKRAARSQVRKADLEKSRFLLKFKRIERLLLQEINDKVNQVNTMQNQVKLFKQTVKIHQRKLKSQIERLSLGRSDSDTLIRYEEDLLKARLSLAEYLFNYRTSLIELDLKQNILLDKYWQEPL
ncbi:MAG: TolC family protein [Candidatus Omnitrophica bacterium]|nr:TolC family protein [Candidatus Omnitrophota bacterium]